MKKRTRVQFEEQPLHPCIRALLAVGALVAILFFVFGCTELQLTPAQVTQINIECNDDATCVIQATDKAMDELRQQLADERRDKQLIRLDKQVAMLNACKASKNHMIFEVQRGRRMLPTEREQRKAMKTHGYPYTHENVNLRTTRGDWKCIHKGDVNDIFRQPL